MTSSIQIDVTLDEQKMPADIAWKAPGGGVPDARKAKAILLGLWDGDSSEALRIDLWTTEMKVDEMADFFYQSMMGMAETYSRATRQTELSSEMVAFAKTFHEKAQTALRASMDETGANG
jgi:gliding motility-associated protein GldC